MTYREYYQTLGYKSCGVWNTQNEKRLGRDRATNGREK
jgi:hypothetical protein